jgi:hypothetical protein
MLHVETTKSIHIPPDQASKLQGSNQVPASTYQKIRAICSKKEQSIQQVVKVSKP